MPPLHRIIRIFLCIGSIILFTSCSQPKQVQKSGDTGSTQEPAVISSPAAENTAAAAGGSILADPSSGLANLAGYRAFLQQDMTGTLDGQPYEKHTRVEITRQASSGDYDFNLDVNGSDTPGYHVRLLAQGTAFYRWLQDAQECQGSVRAPAVDEVIEPSALLLPILNSERVGAETVNQIPSVHYRFDQNSLPIEKGSIVSGEVWIAEAGGYVVKYTLNSPLPDKISGQDLEISQTWSYELAPVDAGQGITLPDGCMAVPVDLPVFTDAQDVSRGGGWLSFTSASGANKLIDFYLAELPALGWTPPETLPQGELSIPFLIEFSKVAQRLTIILDENEAGSLDADLFITTLVLNAEPLADATDEVPAGTPTPAPTVDPSQSGLPEGVPLYPGATNLIKAGDMVMFTCPDAQDVVTDYYDTQMAANGWTKSYEITNADVIMRTWVKDGTTLNIMVMLQDGSTSVIVQKQ